MTLAKSLSQQIKSKAKELGFELSAILRPEPMATFGFFSEWIARNYHGEMEYLRNRRDERKHVLSLMPEAKTIVLVAMNYYHPARHDTLEVPPDRGVISRYAWGDDYHDVMKKRLKLLLAWLEDETGLPLSGRAYVDTGPILERELAARGGLGFIGKNTCLISPRFGSWLFLGELLLPVELYPDESLPPEISALTDNSLGTCGGCTKCIDACPTGALIAPYLIDARKCISYLTIELKGPIPKELRPSIGNRIFGCDICQEVCPWNRKFSRLSNHPEFAPRPGLEVPSLIELMVLDDEGFREKFRKSPIKRAKRRGFLRNVAVALGNWGSEEAVPVLLKSLHDHEPLIRGHSAWALGRICTEEAMKGLREVLPDEPSDWVRQEIMSALQECNPKALAGYTRSECIG